MGGANDEFELQGIHHLALVCSDMARTVEFYNGVLGMPLVKTIELPAGKGQHFFFDIGGGDCLAFFWFPHAPDAVPGVSAPSGLPGEVDLANAVGAMNHVSFTVPEAKFLDYHEKLQAKGVACTPVIDHDDSPRGVAPEYHEGVFVRSFYFSDPDGALLEFACWTKAYVPGADVAHVPRTAAERTVPVSL